MTVLAIILMFAGVFFLAVSCLGVMRLPDFYSRIHAVGKAETLGAMLILGGLAVYNGLAISSLKIVLILIFVLIANPTAAHLLGRAALRSRLEIWTLRDGRVFNESSRAATIERKTSKGAAPEESCGDNNHDLAT